MADQAYTITSLAERWACSRGVIYSLIESGELRTFRLGKNLRITAEEVRRFENGEPKKV